MKRKVLIGIIIAVGILILVSFTSVVGFQKMESDAERLSPLFQIRTIKTLDEYSDQSLTRNYIGKGKTTLFVPSLEEKLKYLFGVDITPEKIEEIRQTIQDNPLILHRLQQKGGKGISAIQQVLGILNIELESNSQQLHTEGPTYCGMTCTGPTFCHLDECNCLQQIIEVFIVFGVMSFGITFVLGLVLLPILAPIFIYATILDKCSDLPSIVQ